MRTWLARSGTGVFCAIAALWAFIAWPWLSGAVTIPYDAKAHFQAQLQFLANALHRGDSPFWTPHIFGGSPQIADPQSLIFSPALLLALFDAAPSFRALDAYVLGLLLLGGFAVAQFGRERGWPLAAQIIAALVFAFGASASWRLQHVGQVQSLACFAVAFWLLARALKHGSWRSGLGAGVAAGVMVVTPDQVDYLGMLVLAGYALWFMSAQDGVLPTLRRVWPALGAGALAGLLIVSGPVLMTWLFSQMSSRPLIEISEAGRGSLHPAFLLTAFVADLFGAHNPGVEFWGPSSAAWSPGILSLSQNMGQVYVGALPALAVVVWLSQGWSRLGSEARFLVCALGAMLVYALGWYTPLFPVLFRWLPGMDLFRRPADATFLLGALMAFLSGYALAGLITAARSGALEQRRLAAAMGAIVVILAVAVAVAAGKGKLLVAAPAIGAALAWLGLSGLLLAALLRARSGSLALAAAAAAVAIVALDLRLNNGPNDSTALPPSVYAELQPNTDNDTITYLKAALALPTPDQARRDRVEFVGAAFHWPNLGMVHGFDHALGYNPLHLAEFTEATGAKDHMGESGERAFTPLLHSFRSTFADILGLRYIISKRPVEQVDKALRPGDLRLLARTRDGFIYENPRALPRAVFVGSWLLADFEKLREEGLPARFDPRAAVLLEQAPERFPLAPPSPARDGQAAVRLVSYANAQVEIEVDAGRPGFLVLHDVWHPWWSATVNGVEADILKANVLFRAVQVPAGRSVVRFSFRPFDGMIAELRERLMGTEEEPAPASLVMIP